MGRYSPHETWTELHSHREMALARRHCREHEKWNEHTHKLPPLKVGDHVYLQNLVGNHPRRWERTGTVVEVRQYHQYVIRVDGTGRVTIRNRQHLRKFTPFHGMPSVGTFVTPTPVVEQPRDVVSNRPPPRATTPQVTQPSVPSSPPCRAQTPLVPQSQPSLDQSTRASTPRRTLRTSPPPVRLNFEPQDYTPGPDVPARSPETHDPDSDTPSATCVPRALARLQPHNTAGHKELLTPRRPNHRERARVTEHNAD